MKKTTIKKETNNYSVKNSHIRKNELQYLCFSHGGVVEAPPSSKELSVIST